MVAQEPEGTDPGQVAAVLEEEDLAQDREAADPAGVGREPADLAPVVAVAPVLRLEGQRAQELDQVEEVQVEEDSDPGQVAAGLEEGLAQDREAADRAAVERVMVDRLAMVQAPAGGAPLRLAAVRA
jgi:hypothetical protein